MSPRFVLAPLFALVAAGLVVLALRDRGPDPLAGLHVEQFDVHGEAPFDPAPWLAAGARGRQASYDIALERISTGVPWPRGLAWHVDRGGETHLIVLARGRHRRSGGIDPTVADLAGTLFSVDPKVAEPVVVGERTGRDVARNAVLFARPTSGPFRFFDPVAGPPADDTTMDRPYCTLRFDEASRNFFICGYSGVDLPESQFRKNASDSVHRFDLRTRHWMSVELHDASTVPKGALSYTVPNVYYPHHDPLRSAPPHGWLNGPDNACVAGDFLYVVSKDNHLLVQYDLAAIRTDPGAPPPPSRPKLGTRVELRLGDETRTVGLYGHSAVAARGGWLYVGYRTSSAVIRLPLDDRGDVVAGAPAELIAVFEPWVPERGSSCNLIDLAFDEAGALYVATATRGRVWRVDDVDSGDVFDGRWSSSAAPFVDLPALSGKGKARVGNILFDDAGRLYACSGNYDTSYDTREGNGLPGVIYRATRR